MRASNLPNVHRFIPNAFQLRNETAKAISSLETLQKRSTVQAAAQAKLVAFFTAALAATNATLKYPKSIAALPNPVVAGAAGTTQQLTVTATAVDNTTSNVSASSTGTVYSTSDATKATVSANGLVTRVATGTATITVQYQNRFTTVPVTIS